ncbi:hypothetical protein PAPHI01_0032 [Pancytospora philotis]|nr:hypothetical protein PAPHI01_0032 [Pancytospora philotis]
MPSPVMKSIDTYAVYPTTLNAAAGAVLSALGAFIVRYYFLAHIALVHGRLSGCNAVLKGGLQGLFALVPVALLLVGNSDAVDKFRIASALPFASSFVLLSAIILLSKKQLQFNVRIYNSIAIAYSASLLLVPLALWGVGGAVAALGLLAANAAAHALLLRRLDPNTVHENGYPRSININNYLFYFKSVLYPFEFVLDHALIIRTKKNQPNVLSLPYRALISPYITLLIALVQAKRPLSFESLSVISLCTFAVAMFLFFSARRSPASLSISLYSLATCCYYLYLILQEQCRILRSFCAHRSLDFAPAAIATIVPQLCLYMLIVHSHFLNIGLRHTVIYASLYTQVILSAFLLLLGAYLGMAETPYAVALDRTALAGLLMSMISSSTLFAYANYFKGKLPAEFAYVGAFYTTLYYRVVQ